MTIDFTVWRATEQLRWFKRRQSDTPELQQLWVRCTRSDANGVWEQEWRDVPVEYQ